MKMINLWLFLHEIINIRHIIMLWKYEKEKKIEKKFVDQGGFELTTLRLEGERPTTELKFSLNSLSHNLWSVFPTKFGKSQFSQLDVVTFEFFSQI